MSAEAEILFEARDGVGTITLNRPKQFNALTFAMYDELAHICADPAKRGATRALIITGAGTRAFAAGTDIAQFRSFETHEDALRYEERIEHVMSTIEQCPVPTIAAISGAVTGGGAAIACCCDMRIATEDARFGFPIAKTLGNCLSLQNYARLVGLMGAARVKDLIFTARLMDASEARAVGVFAEVVADHPALMQRAEQLARTIAAHAPLTIQATKESLARIKAQQTQGLHGADLLLKCYFSQDFREGMEAFLEKRPAVFKGR